MRNRLGSSDIRYWYGLPTPTGISDEWLTRLYSIPGISINAIYYNGFSFYVTGWEYALPSSSPEQKEHTFKHMLDYIEDVANVRVYINPGQRAKVIISRKTPPEQIESVDPETGLELRAFKDSLELKEWRDEVLRRLDQFTSQLVIIPESIEDLEGDILQGVAQAFTWRERTPHNRRDDPIYYYDSSDTATEEATQFLHALEGMHEKSVYELFLDATRRSGLPNQIISRLWFGSALAHRAMKKRSIFDLPTYELFSEMEVPKWWDLMEGPYAACVLNVRPRSLKSEILNSLIVVAHNPSHTWRFMHLYRMSDGKLKVLVNRLKHGVCYEGDLSDAEAWIKQETGYVMRILFSKVCQESINKNDLVGFITEAINLPGHEEEVRNELEESLAECFQA